jgi:hypothetical protein
MLRKLFYWSVNVLTLGGWFSLMACQMYFAYTRPTAPQPRSGRIYPLRVHYTTVYLTRCEHYLTDYKTVSIAFIVVALLAVANYRYGPYYKR